MKKTFFLNYNTRKINKLNFNQIYSFLVNMYYAFEDKDNLYLIIDLMSGGDLRDHIGK